MKFIIVIEKINKLDPKKAKEILVAIYTQHLTPSFGSISKREIDIIMFSQLVDAGMWGANPKPYDIVRDLKVTKAKANSLLYEYNLRKSSDESLTKQMAQLLETPLLDKIVTSRKIGIEVENPLLKEHIRNILKELGYITDTSFNNDILYMSFEAYSDLFYSNSTLDEKQAQKRLVEEGVATSAAEVGDKALNFLLSKFIGEKAPELIDTAKRFFAEITKKNKTGTPKLSLSGLQNVNI